MPTLLEAVDGRPSSRADIDGRSVLIGLREAVPAGSAGPEPDPARWLFWAYEGQLAARLGRWKLVLDARVSLAAPVVVGEGLLDLDADPAERHNLFEVHPEQAAMKPRLLGWAATCAGWHDALRVG
ncbi:hypothetical protein [Actinopolymorpha pittospori]